MTVESDSSQSGTRLNGKLGTELQVSGKSTKQRGTIMLEFGDEHSQGEGSAVPAERPQGPNRPLSFGWE